jgi:long-chain acyl-CoA synthetase
LLFLTYTEKNQRNFRARGAQLIDEVVSERGEPAGGSAAAITMPFRHLAEMVEQTSMRYAKQHAFTAVLPNGMFGNLTFEQIQQYSDAFAVYLREGLGLMVGDRVALQLPNILAYPICAFGVLKAGCVLVNTNPLYTPREMEHQLRDSGAKVLVIVDLFADKVATIKESTAIEHIVLAKITDLFPRLPGFIAYNVLKYWNRAIPESPVAHVYLIDALAEGAAIKQQKALKVSAYTATVGLADIAALQYTGGTTGVSKGAMLTHGNLLANMMQVDQRVASHVVYGKECTLAVLPLYHIFAFTANLLYFFYAGARNILIANPRPLSNLQRALENYPISWIPGVNTLFSGLLNEEWFADYPPPTLRGSLAGGTALFAAVADRWRAVTRTPVIEGYGLTESSPVVTMNPLEASRDGSIGLAMAGTEIRLLDAAGNAVAAGEAGELAVRGPQVMQGYWRRPEETARVLQDGWLLTGDIATVDAEGYYRIVDRKKDMILVSGFNVYPNEVEDCIARLAGVAEVAVIGLPDAKSGEAVKAYVVPQAGVTLTAEQIREHCKDYLTAYKLPRQIEFRSELPKSNVGKVLRRELRDQALNGGSHG